MNLFIEVIAKKVKEHLATGERLIEDLQRFGWADERPNREDEHIESFYSINSLLAGTATLR